MAIAAVGKTDRFSQIYSLTNIILGSVVPFTILITLNGRIAYAVVGRFKVYIFLSYVLG